MEDGRICKGILYGELASSKRPTGHPHVQYTDVVSLTSQDAVSTRGKAKAQNQYCWKQEQRYGLNKSDKNVKHLAQAKHSRRTMEKLQLRLTTDVAHVAVFHSQVGLCSHSCRCSTAQIPVNP